MAYAIAFLPLAIGLWMTIDLLHRAWTDIAARDLSPRARFELLLVMALVTPVAGPVYWLRRKDEETLELRQQQTTRCRRRSYRPPGDDDACEIPRALVVLLHAPVDGTRRPRS